MNVIEAIHGRRSIRRYRPEALERQLVEDLIWAAVQAPTPPPSGDRPWAFCVIEGRERLAELGARAKAYARSHQPADHAWPWAERAEFEVFWGAPLAVVICARSDVAEAALDCARAGQNLLLAAHGWGLGSCWIGAALPWLSSPGAADEIGVPEGFDASVVVILGHPDERPVGQPRARPPVAWCDERSHVPPSPSRPVGPGLAARSFAVATSATLSALLAGCAGPAARVDTNQPPGAREDILILHSVRMSRDPKSAWCTPERAGFAPLSGPFLLEDRFAMWSVRVQPSDGRIEDAKAVEIGPLRACFGVTADPAIVNFYAEATLSAQSMVGNGTCHRVEVDSPEKGISTFRCHLTLRGLAPPYTGGLLTTSSVISRALLSAESDPPGYVQTSIATVRLWRAH